MNTRQLECIEALKRVGQAVPTYYQIGGMRHPWTQKSCVDNPDQDWEATIDTTAMMNPNWASGKVMPGDEEESQPDVCKDSTAT